MDGEIIALEEVPDPVFSQKMLGEGVAMIPVDGAVHAPIDGKVIQVAPTKHAIGLLTEDETEVLIHVGLETVSLDGEGFSVKVGEGDTVSVGQPLIHFDLDYVRTHAKSLITPIVITNSSEKDREYTLVEGDQTGKMGETVLITVSSK